MEPGQTVPAPMHGPPQQAPANPSTVPEMEQVLVKVQELDSRIAELEMKAAQDATGGTPIEENIDSGYKPGEDVPEGGVGVKKKKLEEQMDSDEDKEDDDDEEDKDKPVSAEEYNKLKKKYESLLKEQGEMKGLPEIEKDKKKITNDQAESQDVPQAQTSDIKDDGTKTGAPNAGEETEDKFSKDAENDAAGKVPAPKSEYPNKPIMKNTLGKEEATIGKVTDDTEEDPTTTKDAGKPAPNNPKPMKGEEGQGIPKNAYEAVYDTIKQTIINSDKNQQEAKQAFDEKMKVLSERKSVIGNTGGNPSVLESKQRLDKTIREYMELSGHRI